MTAERPDGPRLEPSVPGPGTGPRGRPTVVELQGDLDLSTSGELRRRLDLTAVTEDLVVDVSGVPFIDSSALGVLARAAVQRAEHGRRVVLVGTGDMVRKVLAITRLGSLLPAVGTLDEAMTVLRDPFPGVD